jgi:ABC-type sugar transport system permease subunit
MAYSKIKKHSMLRYLVLVNSLLLLTRKSVALIYDLPWNLHIVLTVRTWEEMSVYALLILAALIPGDHAIFPE